MSTAPKVTVITATFNYGEFIKDSLLSVEAQTLKEWECIVIDDASTDGTADILKEFVDRDDRFIYIRLEKNGGVSAARNNGLARARGEYIQLLDADDIVGPKKLERHVAFMDGHSDIDMVYSDFVHFVDTPDLTKAGEYTERAKVNGRGNAIIQRLLKGNVFRPATVLFRRSVLARTGNFNAAFRYVEDLDLWFRMAAEGSAFRFLDDPAAMAGVRLNPRGLSTDVPAMSKHLLPVLQNLWNHGRLSLRNRVELVLRYAMFMLDRAVLRRGPILILPEGRWPFLAFVGVAMLLMLPLYPFYKLAQAVR